MKYRVENITEKTYLRRLPEVGEFWLWYNLTHNNPDIVNFRLLEDVTVLYFNYFKGRNSVQISDITYNPACPNDYVIYDKDTLKPIEVPFEQKPLDRLPDFGEYWAHESVGRHPYIYQRVNTTMHIEPETVREKFYSMAIYTNNLHSTDKRSPSTKFYLYTLKAIDADGTLVFTPKY